MKNKKKWIKIVEEKEDAKKRELGKAVVRKEWERRKGERKEKLKENSKAIKE